MKKSICIHVTSLFLFAFITGCGVTGEVGYQPPIAIPIRISVNTEGEINLGLSPSYVTPIGTFDLDLGGTVYSLRGQYTSRLLIVRVDNEATVYELEEGKDFKVNFDDDNTLYKKVALEYESDGDIVLELESVPQPPPNEPVAAPADDNAANTTFSCPGAKYQTRLEANRDARVCTKVDRVIVRKSANMSASEVLSLYTGTTIRVLEGPVCANDFWWWKIEIYPGTTYGKQDYGFDPLGATDQTYYGWVREGWDNEDAYFICQ